MIAKLTELASRVEKKWKEQDLNKESFSEIAYETLHNFEYSKSIDEFDQSIKEWIITTHMPKQLNVYNDFGQPPLTVFNNGRFVVDLYLWMNADTSIHSHSFAGAFKVLHGKSLHEVFEINPVKKYSDDVMSVDIKRNELELLSPGDTRKIVRGDSFNHRLIHLEVPTITLCIRTVDDIKTQQWHHFENGLSIEKRALEEPQIKSLFYGQYLFSKNPEEGLQFIVEQVKKWDISTAMNLFEQLTYDQMGLEEEIVQEYFNTILELYSDTEWFQIYNQFCEDSQNYISVDSSDAVGRLIEHTLNADFTFDQASSLVTQLQGAAPDEMQLMQLEALKVKTQ